MNIITETKYLFKNTFNFNGRMSRKSYWFSYLGILILTFFVGFLSGILESDILNGIWSLIIFIPCLSAGIRRFHDTGKSAIFYIVLGIIESILFIGGLITVMAAYWYSAGMIGSIGAGGPMIIVGLVILLMSLVPAIVAIICLASKGDPEENKYGLPDTHEIEADVSSIISESE